MKRKFYDRLKQWQEQSHGTTALLVQGARRVGKSYIVEKFAQKEYKSYILIDFNIAGKELKNLFLYDITDLEIFFLKLSTLFGVKLFPRESVIIFDEVQLFPRARSVIKYLVADGRYDYIETGSLLSIKENTAGILLPSEEEKVNMYPMDFEEFLWALGNDTMMELLHQCYQKKLPLGQALHRKAMNLFRQYLIVGGMPQAVNAYLETKSFDAVDAVKRRILDLYRDDIQHHSKVYTAKATAIFDEIPSQLKNQNRHFKISALESGARMSAYEEPLFWLADAMIINNCYNTAEPNIGLRLNRERTVLKCYMGDTGLLISHAFDENGIVSEQIYRKLLIDKLEVNMGMVIENVVAQMLAANNKKLYFYTNSDRDHKDNRMEIDFLIAKASITNSHNIIPIEVKSSKNYTLTSLKKCMTKYKNYIYEPLVIHCEDLKIEDNITYLPIYMTMLL